MSGIPCSARVAIRVAVFAPVLCCLAGPRAAQAVELDAVFAYLDLDAAERGQIRSGEIVAKRISTGEEATELAITVAALFGASSDEAYASVARGDTLRADPNLIELREISAWPPEPAEFAGVGFGAGEASEVRRLLDFEGGGELNLSTQEIARFRALRERFHDGSSAEARSAVSAAYRDVLMGRYRAYREQGLAGIAPYHRGGGRSSDPARTLRLAGEAARFFQENEPGLYEAFRRFPRIDREDVEHSFYWIEQRVQDRATFILSHRMLVKKRDYAALAERHYFIGHSYNTVQIVSGAFPVEDGIVVLYTNRTSIDQLAGMAGRMARPIAAGRLMERVVQRFEALRGAR